MPNWTGNSAPNWFKDLSDSQSADRPNHPNGPIGDLYLDARGWVREVSYTDQHGRSRTKEEVVIADRQAQSESGTVFVTDIRVANAADFTTTPPTAAAAASGSGTKWVITFNQPVATGGSTTFTWGGSADDGPGTVTAFEATYVSGNLTNQITVEYDTSTFAATSPVGLTGVCTLGVDAYDTSAGAAISSATVKNIPAGSDITSYATGVVASTVTFVDGATANVVVG